MNDKQIKAFIRSKEVGRKAVSDGLYIRVQTAGIASWEIRYTAVSYTHLTLPTIYSV